MSHRALGRTLPAYNATKAGVIAKTVWVTMPSVTQMDAEPAQAVDKERQLIAGQRRVGRADDGQKQVEQDGIEEWIVHRQINWWRYGLRQG